jgi:alkylated DNA repair dioxygenase AlkB
METLFPVDTIYPEGFSYQPAFITIDEEADLLSAISHFDLHTFHFQGYQAKRKVASFGHDWSFEKRVLSKGKDIPRIFFPVIDKVASHIKVKREEIGELLLTEYPAGSVINWHRDAPPFDLIAGISLKTDCIFKLRPHEKERQSRGSIISLPVARRSLYIMQGASRTDWQHSIAPVKDVRYSITLRTLKA